MSVLIKGMDMPKTCEECDIEDGYYFCPVSDRDTDEVRITGRHKDCPLIEVKEPHGNLIDRDKLLNATVLNPNHAPYITMDDVNDMPVVVELE